MITNSARPTRRHFSALVGGVAATTVLIAACSAGGSPLPTAGGGSGAPSTAGSATAAPGTATPAAPSGAAGVNPTPFVVPDDLTALLPTEIAGNPMTIEAGTPGNFLLLWGEERLATGLLSGLDKTIDDVTIAYSYADVTYPETLHVDAYRVAGADGNAVRDGMVERYLSMVRGWEATSTSMGGKDVTVVGPPNAPAESLQALYAVGDVVFVVSGNPPEWADAAFKLLP